MKRLASKLLRQLRGVACHSLAILASKVYRGRITCIRDDGGGAQIHGRISTIAFAKHYGFSFVNTAINDVDFPEGDDWDDRWNDFFSYPGTIDPGDSSPHHSRDLMRMLLYCIFAGASGKVDVLVSIPGAHELTDIRPSLLQNVAPHIRNHFNFEDDFPQEQIVVHLRRGSDITAGVRFEDDKLLEVRLTNLAANQANSRIRVYTNEPLSKSVSLPLGTTVDCSSSPFTAMSHMSNAATLLIAKSSMSYVSALANKDGVVYTPEFWHPPLSNWRSARELNVA